MRIVGETVLDETATRGGYNVRCGCGKLFSVDAGGETVSCPCGKEVMNTLELAARWWGVEDWTTLSKTLEATHTLKAEMPAPASAPPNETIDQPATVDSDTDEEGPLRPANGTAHVYVPSAAAIAAHFPPEPTVPAAIPAPSATPAQPAPAASAPPRPRSIPAPAVAGEPSEMLSVLLPYGQEEFFPSGAVIIREGSAGDSMYAIRSGIVELTVGDRLVDILEPGAIFGEMAMLDGKPRSASATATTDCSLVRVSKEAFVQLASERFEFVHFLMRVMSERIRRLNGILSTLLATSDRKG